jgi:hypothetical protein
MADRPIRIEADERLTRAPQKPASLSWPIPVDDFLDELVKLAEDAGESTTRRELLAAIVVGTPADPEYVAGLLKDYRLSTVGKLAGKDDPGPADNIVEFQRRGPGPRPRHG